MSDTQRSEKILEVTDLRKSFGGIQAVDGVSFDIEEGKITGLIGPNGAGKTTMFNLLSGFYEPDSGEIRFKGTDLTDTMRSSTEENIIWSAAASVTLGGTAMAISSAGGAATLPAVGTGALGALVGIGGYFGQSRLRTDILKHRPVRPFQVARSGLSRTFQMTRELQRMTVEENLLLAPQNQSGESLYNSWFRRASVRDEERAVRERAEEMLELLELGHLRNESAGNLSGGQRKLLELGRILMTDPDVILLDEPVAGVNPSLMETLLSQIKTLRDEGYTFCIVEHDMEVIMDLSDTVIVMDQGQKLTGGSPATVRQDERVLEAYLGGE